MLEVNASQIHARYPTHATLDTPNHLFTFLLQDYHPLWCSIPRDFELDEEDVPESKTPHLLTISGRIQFALYRFRSTLITASRLISFPSLTKMFQFGEFPILTDCWRSAPAGSPIRRPRDLRFLAPTPRVSSLGTTFISARAEPSTRRLSDCSNYFQSGTHPGLRMIGNHRIKAILYPSSTTLFHVAECIINIVC